MWLHHLSIIFHCDLDAHAETYCEVLVCQMFQENYNKAHKCYYPPGISVLSGSKLCLKVAWLRKNDFSPAIIPKLDNLRNVWSQSQCVRLISYFCCLHEFRQRILWIRGKLSLTYRQKFSCSILVQERIRVQNVTGSAFPVKWMLMASPGRFWNSDLFKVGKIRRLIYVRWSKIVPKSAVEAIPLPYHLIEG